VHIFQALAHAQHIKQVSLSGHNLTAAPLEALASTMQRNASVSSWSFGNRNLSDDDLHFLAESIKANSTMKKLDLEFKALNGSKSDAWLPVLMNHSSLEIVNLSRNALTDSSFLNLGSLTPNISLKKLDLTDNNLGVVAAKAMSHFLTSEHCGNVHHAMLHMTRFSVSFVRSGRVVSSI
jgi:Ran GTPase-activating protein (RanGAP) involved in mRNA processing and transport